MVQYPVGIDLGIDGQLIDQMIHLVSLIINCFQISVHFFRSIRHAIHNAFHISLNGGQGRLEVMGNIADQLPVFLVQDQLFLRRFLEPPAHVLKVLEQLGKFVALLRFETKIQISVPDIPGRLFQFIDRVGNALVYPDPNPEGGQEHNDRHSHKEVQRLNVNSFSGAGHRHIVFIIQKNHGLRTAVPLVPAQHDKGSGKKYLRDQDNEDEARRHLLFKRHKSPAKSSCAYYRAGGETFPPARPQGDNKGHLKPQMVPRAL